MENKSEEIEPKHFGGKTLSNKPWGIACYSLQQGWILKKHWLLGQRWTKTNTLYWTHLMNSFYDLKRSQLQALEDLSKKYTQYRFVPFKNNFKQLPQDRIKMKSIEI